MFLSLFTLKARSLSISVDEGSATYNILDGDKSLSDANGLTIWYLLKENSYPSKKTDGTAKKPLDAKTDGIKTEYSYTPIDAESNIIKITTKITSSKAKYSWFGFIWDAKFQSSTFSVAPTSNNNYGYILTDSNDVNVAYTILFFGYEDATERLGRSFVSRSDESSSRTFTNTTGEQATNAEIFSAYWKAELKKDEPVEIIYYLAKGKYDPPAFSVNGEVNVKESYEAGETFSVPVKHGYAKTGRSSTACYEIYDSTGKAVDYKEVDTFTRVSSGAVEKTYQYNIKLPVESGQYTIKLYSKYETFNSTSVKYEVTVQNSNAVPTLTLPDNQPDEDGFYEGSEDTPIEISHNGKYSIHAVYGIDAAGVNVKLNYQFWDYEQETMYSEGTLDEFTTGDSRTKDITTDIEMPEVDSTFYLVLKSVSGDKQSDEQKLYFFIYNEKIQVSFDSKPSTAVEVGTEYSFVFTIKDDDDNSIMFRYTINGETSEQPRKVEKTEETTHYTFKWIPTSEYVNKDVTLNFYFNDTVEEVHLTSKHKIIPKTPKFEVIDEIEKTRYRHDEDFIIHARYGYAESGVTVKAQYELVNNNDESKQSGEIGHFVTTASKLYEELDSCRIPLPEVEGDYVIRIWAAVNDVKSDPAWSMTIHIYNQPIKLEWVEPIAENIEVSTSYSFKVTVSDEDDTSVSISAGIGEDRSDRRTLSLTDSRSSVETFTFTAPSNTGSIDYYIEGKDSSSQVSIHRRFNIIPHAPPELSLTKEVETEIHHDKNLYVHYQFGVKRAGEKVHAIYELYDYYTGKLVKTDELYSFTTENGLDNQIKPEIVSPIPVPEEEKTYKLHLYAKVGEEKSTPVVINEIRVINSKIVLSFAEEYKKEVHVGEEIEFKIKVTDIDDNDIMFGYSINSVKFGVETPFTKSSESAVYTHTFRPDNSYANKEVTIVFAFNDDNYKSTIEAKFKVLPSSKPNPPDPANPDNSEISVEQPGDSPGNEKESTDEDPKLKGGDGKKGSGKTAGIAIGVIIAVLVIVAIVVAVILLMKRKSDNDAAQDNAKDESIDMMNEETCNTSTAQETATADNPLFTTAEIDDAMGFDSDSPDGENV